MSDTTIAFGFFAIIVVAALAAAVALEWIELVKKREARLAASPNTGEAK